MAALYIRKDSPFYYIRYYDVHEEDPAKRPKSLPTKIEVTAADRSKRLTWEKKGKIGKAPKVNGNNETKVLLQRVISASVDLNIEAKTGLKIKKQIALNQGLQEFLNSKPKLKPASIHAYELAEWHLREAITDKPILYITRKDFNKLISRFDDLGAALTSIDIHTRHLYAMFRYFVKRKYIEENPITVMVSPKREADPIPRDDMEVILKHFQSKYLNWDDERKIEEAKAQYHLIYFLLLTGFRISSALAQVWEKIVMKENMMTAINVKARGKEFYFPIHPELKKLLKLMGPGEGDLFPYSFKRGSPVFWRRGINYLYENKKILRKYRVHDLRKTFTSWMVNSGVNPSVLQKLLNHSDIRVTNDIYTKMETKLLGSQFQNIKFKSGKYVTKYAVEEKTASKGKK